MGKSSFEETHNIEASLEYFRDKKVFDIGNRDSFIKTHRNKMIFWLCAVILCAAIAVAAAVYDHTTGGKQAMFVTILMSITAVALLVCYLIPAAIQFKKIKTIPSRVTIDENVLSIGDLNLSYGNILNISMVPGSYKILTRDLIIVTKDNNKYRFNFGKNDPDKKLRYKDYDDIYQAINLWSIIHKINFLKILG